MASPIRLDPELLAAAEREGVLRKRSIPKQIEFWAELGKAVENIISMEDVMAVAHGIKKIKLETLKSEAVDADDLFSEIEDMRNAGKLSENLTSSNFYYEASQTSPGFLDRVEAKTGIRATGNFVNGSFRSIP